MTTTGVAAAADAAAAVAALLLLLFLCCLLWFVRHLCFSLSSFSYFVACASPSPFRLFLLHIICEVLAVQDPRTCNSP